MVPQRTARAGQSGSILLHGAILIALLAASNLRIDALGDPSVKTPTLLGIVGPAAAAAAGPPRSRGKPPSAPPESRDPEPRPGKTPEVVQPQTIPEDPPGAPPQEAPPEADGVESGIEGGMDGGRQGGVPGGDPDGVADGGPFGVPGAPGPGHGAGPSPGEPDPVRLTGEVRPPERTVFVKPEYPEIARVARVQAKVILEIVVGREGDVEEVAVLRSHPLFDRAAVEAVSRWKYRPALQDGRPVRVYMTVIVTFALE